MTISTVSSEISHNGNDVTTDFDYPGRIFALTDIQVYSEQDGGESSILLSYGTHYTLTGLGSEAGGVVRFATAPSTGVTVKIKITPSLTQPTRIKNQSRFYPETHEDLWDRMTMALQAQDRLRRQSLHGQDYGQEPDMELPVVEDRKGKYLIFDEVTGAPLAADSVDPVALSAAVIGNLIFSTLTAETNAGITPNKIYPSLPYDLRRAGLVPNSVGARAANTTAIKNILNADVDGPRGWFTLPNTTGVDTYYFNMDDVPIRDGCVIDGQGCTVDVAGSYSASNDLHGFFEGIRNVHWENFLLNVNYDGSSGTNNGMGIRIGSRNGYPFGADADGIEDEDLATPMGGCSIKDVRVVTNNPSGAAILLLGGLEGGDYENITVNGSALNALGIYYEFGFWHYEATVANRKSSHANNQHFKNIRIENMKATTPSVGFSLVGVMAATVEGLNVDGGFNSVVIRCGEALYYNMGTPNIDQRAHVTMRGVVTTDSAGTTFSFLGAESKAGGYLSGEAGVTEAKQCDLISLSLDGFSLEGTTLFSGRSVKLANGVNRNGTASGGILLQDECMFFDIDNVHCVDSAGLGIRCQSGTNIFAVARLKTGSIRNSLIAGHASHGMSFDNTKSVYVGANRIGYTVLQDGVAETTQDSGVSVAAAGSGVVMDSNDIATSGGATAYVLAGNSDRGCEIRNPRGTASFTGSWKVDGVARATSTQIIDITHAINTDSKYTGKQVYDTSNTRLMFAQGSTAGSTWKTAADFGAGDAIVTVTPV